MFLGKFHLINYLFLYRRTLICYTCCQFRIVRNSIKLIELVIVISEASINNHFRFEIRLLWGEFIRSNMVGCCVKCFQKLKFLYREDQKIPVGHALIESLKFIQFLNGNLQNVSCLVELNKMENGIKKVLVSILKKYE